MSNQEEKHQRAAEPRSARFNTAFEGGVLSGRQREPASPPGKDYPLIIALHGGTYSSAYFDLPGFSLLERAAALGLPIIALDRPGYGETTPLAPADATVAHNAEWLDDAIGHVWRHAGGAARGVVLIGHSIGGAITVSIAARRPSWPLLGIAVSGVGMVTPPESGEQWAALPDIPMIDLPGALKEQVMFGPSWTFEADAPERSHASDAPVPRAELIDIVTTWHSSVKDLAARVQVPVHYRQGEFDRLWITGEDQIAGFAAAFTHSPRVDAANFYNAGHCIDFHRLGAAFQLEQLAFALRCCVRPPQA
ncbi:alpha/beta hydrolase [Pusillimonas noertemannii]|uniref:alpha/beta hydrolase n=1 Tax=Pusillimonas noertemannii TaxID=305977 RepID=UPI00031369C0|nr:alpha/beta fold hydrolase [Pusillimonas noertemannii]